MSYLRNNEHDESQTKPPPEIVKVRFALFWCERSFEFVVHEHEAVEVS